MCVVTPVQGVAQGRTSVTREYPVRICFFRWDTDAAVVASFDKRTWVRDYLWNFTMTRTRLQEPFVLVMHQLGKLRYFLFNYHMKAPPSPQCPAANNNILETAIILAFALRFVWRTDPRSRWLAFRQKFTFWFSCALGCRASSLCLRIPEIYSNE